MSPYTRFQPVDAIATEVVDGELVLLQLNDGVYFGLDRLGTQIWHWLAAGHSLEQVSADLGDAYRSEPQERLQLDLQALVNALLAANLVEPSTDRGR